MNYYGNSRIKRLITDHSGVLAHSGVLDFDISSQHMPKTSTMCHFTRYLLFIMFYRTAFCIFLMLISDFNQRRQEAGPRATGNFTGPGTASNKIVSSSNVWKQRTLKFGTHHITFLFPLNLLTGLFGSVLVSAKA